MLRDSITIILNITVIKSNDLFPKNVKKSSLLVWFIEIDCLADTDRSALPHSVTFHSSVSSLVYILY